ncbi:MAG: hypothetical protein ABWY82_15275 [Tardiphaga sp.]
MSSFGQTLAMGKPIYEHGSKEVSQFTLIGAAIWLLENEQLFKPAADRFKNLLQSRDDFSFSKPDAIQPAVSFWSSANQWLVFFARRSMRITRGKSLSFRTGAA